MVVWGIALPNADENWTTFVSFADSSAAGGTSDLDFPIPDVSRKTLSMAGQDGNQLIGFSGGQINEAIAFYKQWASENNWTEKSTRNTNQHWHQEYLPPESKTGIQAGGIQVQLMVDSQDNLRGLLVVQANTKFKNKETAQ